MSSVDELFDRYKADFTAGRAEGVEAYLARVSGADRRELSALIEAFLARGARPPYTPEAFAAAAASPLAQRVMASLEEGWPQLLPRARDRAGILRSEVVARLAQALGVTARQDKVERYYHQMERGLLPPAGVSDRVLDALGEIIGVSRERLRAAGRVAPPPPPPPPAAAAPAFARAAPPVAASKSLRARVAQPEPPQWDEVDELFRGGGRNPAGEIEAP